MTRQVNSHEPVLKPRAAKPPLVMHDCSIGGMHSPEIGARNTCCGMRLSKSSRVRWQCRWSAGAPMIPAVLAISGVSAHACSHHRDCRVGQCVQVSGRRTTPTCATGGSLGGASDYRSMLLPVVRILVWCNQTPRLVCSPSWRPVPSASPGLSFSTRASEEQP